MDQADKPLHELTEDPRYIGRSVERPSARKLVQGQGTYIDDIELPRMAHVVYWRSPVAHCRITRIDAQASRGMPGVILVADGHDLAKICKPWVAVLGHLAGMKSAPQYPLALDRACWQGEPVVAIVAETREQAESLVATEAAARRRVRLLADDGDPRDFARRLYDDLRRADADGIETVVALLPADEGIGSAIRDRLRKAAAGSVIRR